MDSGDRGFSVKLPCIWGSSEQTACDHLHEWDGRGCLSLWRAQRVNHSQKKRPHSQYSFCNESYKKLGTNDSWATAQPCWCQRSALPMSEVSCTKLAFQLLHQTALNGHVGLFTGKVSPSQGTSGYCFGGEERGGDRVVTETPTDSLCPTQ